MKKNLLYVLIVVAMMLALVPTASAAPNAAVACAQTYTVTAGDSLSALADKFLGNLKAYWALMAQTNYKNVEDSSYTLIKNPDQLEVGDKLCVPTKAEADAILAKFGDPAKGNVSVLFGAKASGQLLGGNWWTSGGELAAINAVYNLYAAKYPDVTIVNAGVAGGGGVNFKGANLTKLQGGDPYDVFQLHAGKEVAQYDPEKYLTPVDDIITEGEGSVMPASLKNLLVFNGKMWTVPMNIHRGNVLWINKKVFANAGLTPPTTMDEFFTAADALKGKGVIPLAMGGSEGFEQPQTFEVVLVATVGGQGLNDLWSGKMKWSDSKVTDALNTYKKLLTYTNDDRAALAWSDAIKLVIDGKAAMSIMGDWSDGEFIKAAKTDAEYAGVPAPGNKGSFMLVSDGFALPAQAPDKTNAVNFLKLITTKEAQEAFNIKKGSICSRTDCDYSKFDAYLQSSAKDFAVDTIVPSATHGSAIVPAWANAFYDVLKKFVADGDVASAQKALVQAANDNGVAQ